MARNKRPLRSDPTAIADEIAARMHRYYVENRPLSLMERLFGRRRYEVAWTEDQLMLGLWNTAKRAEWELDGPFPYEGEIGAQIAELLVWELDVEGLDNHPSVERAVDRLLLLLEQKFVGRVEHDKRVTELLKYNNEQLERRRAMEAEAGDLAVALVHIRNASDIWAAFCHKTLSKWGYR